MDEAAYVMNDGRSVQLTRDRMQSNLELAPDPGLSVRAEALTPEIESAATLQGKNIDYHDLTQPSNQRTLQSSIDRLGEAGPRSPGQWPPRLIF